MNLNLKKADIKNIGHTAFQQNGKLLLICDSLTANIEKILLKNLLLCFGRNYRIVSIENFYWNKDNLPDILIKTNLPYETYTNLHGIV